MSNGQTMKPGGSQPHVFENHAEAQRILLGLTLLTVLEAVPMHFLLRAWKPWLAWFVLALTLNGLWYLATAYRSLGTRPHVLSAERLLLRVGSFYTVDVERAAITRASRYTSETDVVALKFVSKPNVFVELSEPVRVFGPFGRTQLAMRLAFYTAEPDALLRELNQSPMRVASHSSSRNAGASASIHATSETK